MIGAAGDGRPILGRAHLRGAVPVGGITEAELAGVVASPGPEAAVLLQGQVELPPAGDGRPVVWPCPPGWGCPSRVVSPRPSSPYLFSAPGPEAAVLLQGQAVPPAGIDCRPVAGRAHLRGTVPLGGVAQAEPAVLVVAPGPQGAVGLQRQGVQAAAGDGCPVVGRAEARGRDRLVGGARPGRAGRTCCRPRPRGCRPSSGPGSGSRRRRWPPSRWPLPTWTGLCLCAWPRRPSAPVVVAAPGPEAAVASSGPGCTGPRRRRPPSRWPRRRGPGSAHSLGMPLAANRRGRIAPVEAAYVVLPEAPHPQAAVALQGDAVTVPAGDLRLEWWSPGWTGCEPQPATATAAKWRTR